jgi:hypothetical protein
MNINYNKIEHLELLKKKYVDRNSEDSGKLLRYSTMTNGRLDWCVRENYLELLEDFRKGGVETFEFCITFENTGKLTSDIMDILESNLIILSPDEKSLGFSNLLEEVFDLCGGYLQDAEFRDETSEIEFKNSIEEIYFQIQKFCKKIQIFI